MYKWKAYISVSLLLPPFSSQSVTLNLVTYKALSEKILICKFNISASSMLDNTLLISFSEINLIDLMTHSSYNAM